MQQDIHLWLAAILTSTLSSIKHILEDVNRKAQNRTCKHPEKCGRHVIRSLWLQVTQHVKDFDDLKMKKWRWWNDEMSCRKWLYENNLRCQINENYGLKWCTFLSSNEINANFSILWTYLAGSVAHILRVNVAYPYYSLKLLNTRMSLLVRYIHR